MTRFRKILFLLVLVAAMSPRPAKANMSCPGWGYYNWPCYPNQPSSCNSGCYAWCQLEHDYGCYPSLYSCVLPNYCECVCDGGS